MQFLQPTLLSALLLVVFLCDSVAAYAARAPKPSASTCYACPTTAGNGHTLVTFMTVGTVLECT
jgi:hypothetical protein